MQVYSGTATCTLVPDGQHCGVPAMVLEMELTRYSGPMMLAKVPQPSCVIAPTLARTLIHVLQVLPVALCTIAAFGSLFTSITVAMPRFAASIISFLTAMNIFNSVLAVLPSTAYGCYLIVWLTFQMMLLSVLIMHTMLMYGVNKTQGGDAVKKCDHIALVGSTLWWLQSWGWAALMVGGYDNAALYVVVSFLFVLFVVAVILYGKYYVQPFGAVGESAPKSHQVQPEPTTEFPAATTPAISEPGPSYSLTPGAVLPPIQSSLVS